MHFPRSSLKTFAHKLKPIATSLLLNCTNRSKKHNRINKFRSTLLYTMLYVQY